MLLQDVLTPVSAVTAAIVILLSIVYYFMKNRDILPGPTGLPFFGLYPFLKDETCHLQLQDIGKKYGDLYSFTYTGNTVINLGSVRAIREAHVNKSDCFAGRFEKFNMLTYILEGGVAMSNGETWRVQRKFFIQTFKEYGLTAMRENTVGPVYDSISKTIEDLKSREGSPFNVIDLLVIRCTVTMRKVLFGEDGVTDEQIQAMNTAYAVALERMTGVNLLLIGSFGKFIFHALPSYRNCLEQHRYMTELLMNSVKNIESKLDENHATCVVEDFYKEQRQRKKRDDPTWIHFSDKALVASLAQIVGDGILSVAYFIGCFLYALVQHPEEQEKIYHELMEIVGPSRMPTHEDRSLLPYTNAFMYEVTRTSNFFPLFPSLECTKETTLRGFKIPKDSITLLNIWQAHHDPGTYENPDTFDPLRFIPTEGKTRPELPVLFGIGKRACSGEPFVMMQAFLFLTSIVKNFTVSEPPNAESKSELFLMTGFMELSFTPRDET